MPKCYCCAIRNGTTFSVKREAFTIIGTSGHRRSSEYQTLNVKRIGNPRRFRSVSNHQTPKNADRTGTSKHGVQIGQKTLCPTTIR